MNQILQVKLKVGKSPKPNKAVRSLTSGRSPGKALAETTFSAHPHKLLQQGLPGQSGHSSNYALAGQTSLRKRIVNTGRYPFSAEITGL